LREREREKEKERENTIYTTKLFFHDPEISSFRSPRLVPGPKKPCVLVKGGGGGAGKEKAPSSPNAYTVLLATNSTRKLSMITYLLMCAACKTVYAFWERGGGGNRHIARDYLE